MARQSPVNLIRGISRKYGIDPRAAIAVAMGEGGLINRSGDVGDLSGGGSYGPFQLYAQGALPRRFRGRPQQADAWAWSPQGIDYAISRMAQSGARGLTGRAAIESIVRRFERPADPEGSISRAVGRYGGIGAGPAVTGAPAVRTANRAVRTAPTLGAGTIGRAAAVPAPRVGRGRDFAMDLIAQVGAGGAGDFGGAVQRFMQTQQRYSPADLKAAMQRPMPQAPELEAQSTGGTTAGPPPDAMPAAGNSATTRAVRAAASVLGTPYVWGAENPSEGGFDCSGLIDWAYRQAGVDLPGRLTTYSALKVGRSVKGQSLMPGDMVITGTGGHMVLYAGGGRVIAAPHTGAVVRYQPLSDFNIVDVRRIG